MSWYISRTLLLIGIGTKPAESEHELMKGTGRVFCPLRLLSRPGGETGYTVSCQQSVSGNYGLHGCLGALSSCLLTRRLTRIADVWPGTSKEWIKNWDPGWSLKRVAPREEKK